MGTLFFIILVIFIAFMAPNFVIGFIDYSFIILIGPCSYIKKVTKKPIFFVLVLFKSKKKLKELEIKN